MNRSGKIFGLLLLLCSFSYACGDIIKTRDPRKNTHEPEAEQKTSALYGTCINFQGNWTLHCPEDRGTLPPNFFLVQQFCDLFQMQNPAISFQGPEIAWSEERETVTLQNDLDRIVLKKEQGVRSGIWKRGAQECRLTWAR